MSNEPTPKTVVLNDLQLAVIITAINGCYIDDKFVARVNEWWVLLLNPTTIPFHNLLFYVLLNVFAHFLIDATSVVDKWLHLIDSRSWKNAKDFLAGDHREIEKQAMVAYTAIVQTVADNTLHLICLLVTLPLLKTA